MKMIQHAKMNKRVKITLNHSHKIGTYGILVTPPGGHNISTDQILVEGHSQIISTNLF